MQKKFLFCLIVFSFMTILSASGVTYTDASGMTWTYNSRTINGTPAVYISSVSGNATEVTVPDSLPYSGINRPVMSLECSFSSCKSLTKVILPSTVVQVSSSMFNGCANLETVDWQAGVNIPSSCFSGCTKLKEVVLNSLVTEIGQAAFKNCTSLWKITLPQALTTISKEAFYDCGQLDLIVPANVQTIGENAFYNCLSVHMQSATPATLSSGNLLGQKAIVLVQDGVLDTYQNAAYWSLFRDKILAEGAQRSWTVSIIAHPSQSSLHTSIGETNMLGVERLKVSGTFNSYDIMTIRNKMRNLKYLDLSDARVVANKYEYYTGFCSHDDSLVNWTFSGLNLVNVKLPKQLKYITHAFENCAILDSVEFQSGIETIGDATFMNSSLHHVNIPTGTKVIGEGAFTTTRLTNVVIPSSVEYIGKGAFANRKNSNKVDNLCTGEREDYVINRGVYICNQYYYAYTLFSGTLQSITFAPNSRLKAIPEFFMAGQEQVTRLELPDHLQVINEGAFLHCTAIDTIIFPSSLTTIGKGAFQLDLGLTKIVLPPHLETISTDAFLGCSNLDEVRISSSIRTIEDRAFYACCNVSKVYTYTVEPTNISMNTFSCWTVADLYVPRTSYYNYFYNTQWSQFVKLIEFEEDYDFFYLNGDYTIGGEHGVVSGEPDVELNPGAGLIVVGDSLIGLGNISAIEDENGGSSIIADDNLKAEALNLHLLEKKGQWHFFTFPYDVNRSEIHCGSEYVIREYNGQTRAQNGSGGWQNVPVGQQYIQGKGYIFQSAHDDTLSLFRANPVILYEDFTYPLSLYPAASAWDANWNMIGNPYISYYDLDSLSKCGFDYPVIVWNGKGYDTYRLGDDEYHFMPLQGFFVQNANLSQITFSASGRETRSQINEKRANKIQGAPARAAGVSSERKLINLTLSSDVYTDRARVVFNDGASVGYEIGVDAAKFADGGTPVMLYSIGQSQERYAINERPFSNAAIALGYYAQASGTFTLATTRMDTTVIIYDNELRTEVDLSAGDYTFDTEAGYNDTRFTLQLSAPRTLPTDLQALNLDEFTDVTLYNALGQCLGEHINLNNVSLRVGAYLAKSKSIVTKIVVK